jgi:hypothetical protein
MNIKHLPDLARWKIEQKFKKVNFENVTGGIEAGGGIINMHLLYIPTFLSIRCLPEGDKQEVRERFRELGDWLFEHYRKDDYYWAINPYGWQRWQAVLDFMDGDDHSYLLPAFKEYVNTMDQERGTDFAETFPELKHLV